MRSRPAVAGALAAPAVLLAACGGSSTSTAGSGSSTPAAPSGSTGAPSASTGAAGASGVAGKSGSTAPSPAGGQLVSVTFTHGGVTPRGYTAKVRLGTPVRLLVHADVQDEVHVHGYDRRKQLQNGTAEVDLTADTPGLFEVELERRGYLLLHLQVQ